MPKPTTVTNSPMTILTGTNLLAFGYYRVYFEQGRQRSCECHLGFQRGSEDSGATPRGRSWVAGTVAHTVPVRAGPHGRLGTPEVGADFPSV